MTAEAAGAVLERGGARPRGIPRRLPAVLGALGLAGVAGTGVWLALEAASGPSARLVPASRAGFPDWLAGPFGHVLSGRPAAGRFWAVFIAMCVCYVLVLACARSLPVRVGLGVVVGLHLLFLLAPPMLSRDVFNYVVYARMDPLHGLNPYLHGAGAIPFDEAYRYECCHHSANPYGPVFTLVNQALTPLGVPALMWIQKAAVGLAGLGCVALLWVCARRRGIDPFPAALFLGLNPLVLVFAVGGAHNDVLMELLVIAGIAVWLTGREGAGAATAVASLGVKISGLVTVPFMVVGSRRPLRALGAAVGAGAALAVAFVAGYGIHAPEGLARAIGQQQSGFYLRDVPQQLGLLLGLGARPSELKPFLILALAALMLYLLWRTWRGADWITSAGWATLGVLVTSTWLLPWYIIWLLPLAGLSHDRRLRLATLGFGAYIVWARTPLVLG